VVVPWGTLCFDKGGLGEPTSLLVGPCSYFELLFFKESVRCVSISSGQVTITSYRYHLSSWQSIARPKKYGGWGLRNIFIFYRAFGSNTMWRALMKHGIWQRVLKDKYFLHVSVLTWLRSAEPVHPFGSQTWKNLRNTLPIILHWMAWKPGSGHSIISRKGCDLRPGT
jgi:hypothetical protein